MSTPPRRRPPRAPLTRHRAGPTDIADPLIRQEAKRAMIWLGLAGLIALAVVLAQSLMVVFGGMVFGALIDGGARVIGRVLPIGRGWRVALVLLAATLFTYWVIVFAGNEIAGQAAALPSTLQSQGMHILHWAEHHGLAV
ncbi:MAG TPA: AI-2E family transporter, partial [Novosphingobium sp.]|nr:AI-2E family transporter [Novosphingobium sp.]